jgi:hypothetical protein
MSVRSIVVVLGNVNRSFRLMWWLLCHQSFADSSSLQMQVNSLVANNRLSGSRSVRPSFLILTSFLGLMAKCESFIYSVPEEFPKTKRDGNPLSDASQ